MASGFEPDMARTAYAWVLAIVSLCAAFGLMNRITYQDAHPVVIVSLAIMTISSAWAAKVVNKNPGYSSSLKYQRLIMIFLTAFAIGLAFTYTRLAG